MGQQVKIDKAIVKRRDQRIGQRMRHLRQAGVAAGAIYDDEI
jgi:hypothetical protein